MNETTNTASMARDIDVMRDVYMTRAQREAYNRIVAAAKPVETPALAVWCGPMPESNGRQNWSAMLCRKGENMLRGPSVCVERSEYPDRVRYEADRLRYLIGEIDVEPDITAYDAELHSGYVAPEAPTIDLGVPGATIAIDGRIFTIETVRTALIGLASDLVMDDGAPAEEAP